MIAILDLYQLPLHWSHHTASGILPSNFISRSGFASFNFFIVSSISVFSAKFASLFVLQCGQTHLTNLCATIRFSDGANIYGFTHILISLGILSIAEFVCKVVNTLCHVSEAFILISAVSLSLVSHTSIISGSCLNILFNHSEYVYHLL